MNNLCFSFSVIGLWAVLVTCMEDRKPQLKKYTHRNYIIQEIFNLLSSKTVFISWAFLKAQPVGMLIACVTINRKVIKKPNNIQE